VKTKKRKKRAKFTKPKARPSKPSARTQALEVQAAKDFAHHLDNAMRAFGDTTAPLWQRTQNGLMAFKGLDMTHLPPRLGEAVDTHFGSVNRILSQYDLKTWDDYKKISNEDLLNIHSLVERFAQDE
jgi:hypothetical protein